MNRSEMLGWVAENVISWGSASIDLKNGCVLRYGAGFHGWEVSRLNAGDALILECGGEEPVKISDWQASRPAMAVPTFTTNKGYESLAAVFERALVESHDDDDVADLMGEGHLLCLAVDMLKLSNGSDVSGRLARAIGHIADAVVMVSPDLALANRHAVLQAALDQAQSGKGDKRHANAKPFDKQPMQTINRLVGVGFSLGQSIKKIQESLRMPVDAKVHELLGAMNYTAGTVIFIESQNHDFNGKTPSAPEQDD